MKIAHFKIFKHNEYFPNPNTPIQEYDLEYTDAKDLKILYQEAREVWYEYDVEVYYENNIVMGYSETRQAQISRELKDVGGGFQNSGIHLTDGFSGFRG